MHRRLRVPPYSFLSFFFMRFCVQCSFDIDDYAAKQIDTEGTTFRSRPPTLLLVFPLQSTCPTTGRATDANRAPVGVYSLLSSVSFQIIVAPSFLFTYAFFSASFSSRARKLLRRAKGRRKRDDDILLSVYL